MSNDSQKLYRYSWEGWVNYLKKLKDFEDGVDRFKLRSMVDENERD
jgi:hypothetical protein